MNYYGEKDIFSFRSNFCESLKDISTESAAGLGRVCGGLYGRIYTAFSDSKSRPVVFSFCAGAAEAGSEVFLSENTDCHSFRFGIGHTSAECGFYFTENKISFYNRQGFPMTGKEITENYEKYSQSSAGIKGRIIMLSPLREIYLNSIADTLRDCSFPFNAFISCGCSSVRNIWHHFFNGENEKFILQVSDDGMHVNAYSSDYGFISYERLILAYCAVNAEKNKTVVLPDEFHFTAEDYAEKYHFKVIRASFDEELTEKMPIQRFLCDPLYMCTGLFRNYEKFNEIIGGMPAFGSARREICTEICNQLKKNHIICDKKGRIILSRSGKNTLSLTAQAYDSETASELCSVWEKKMRGLGSCTNLFHSLP